MDNRIVEVYNNSITIIFFMEQVSYYLRNQNYKKAMELFAPTIYYMKEALIEILNQKEYFSSIEYLVNENNINRILNSLMTSQEEKNYLQLEYIQEQQLGSLVYGIVGCIIEQEPNLMQETVRTYNFEEIKSSNAVLHDFLHKTENNIKREEQEYQIEFALSGIETMSVIKNNCKMYIHSNVDPLREAVNLANIWYNEATVTYIIYGIGLGYHITMLGRMDEVINVEVYDNNLEVMELAHKCNPWFDFSDYANVTIHYDPSLSKLEQRLKNIGTDTEVQLYYPSLHYIREEKYFAKLNSLLSNVLKER